MKLESSAIRPGQPIPAIHTCDGEDISPDLAWREIPEDTRSFALIMDDPDAPRGIWVHWVLFNLPADAVELAPGVPKVPELPSGARQGLNDSGDIGYSGPCPPPGPPHRYYFHLYALDAEPAAPGGITRRELLDLIDTHIIEQARLVGTY